jgi:3'(2'), 5'-bisphosphate nucleotidase
MNKRYDRELATAIAAVTEAATICQAVQASITPDVLKKKDKSPVTLADFASQAVVCRALGEVFPDDSVVAEEDAAELRQPENEALLQKVVRQIQGVRLGASGADVCRWIDRGGSARYQDRFWTLDPIDGTKGFLRGEQYAVALALIVDGEPSVAALACPNLDGGAVFTAIRCQGAFVRSLGGGDNGAIAVSRTSDTAAARFCESVESGHSAHDEAAAVAEALGITTPPVRMDSQCKYAVVARGRADIYMRLPTRADYVERIWDHAAGALIVTEAGGKVTDVAGRPLEFTHGRGLERNRGVLATNGAMHDRLLAALEQVGVK